VYKVAFALDTEMVRELIDLLIKAMSPLSVDATRQLRLHLKNSSTSCWWFNDFGFFAFADLTLGSRMAPIIAWVKFTLPVIFIASFAWTSQFSHTALAPLPGFACAGETKLKILPTRLESVEKFASSLSSKSPRKK